MAMCGAQYVMIIGMSMMLELPADNLDCHPHVRCMIHSGYVYTCALSLYYGHEYCLYIHTLAYYHLLSLTFVRVQRSAAPQRPATPIFAQVLASPTNFGNKVRLWTKSAQLLLRILFLVCLKWRKYVIST